jgi:hypothetical protein
LILASVLSVAIIIERFISLRATEVTPKGLLEKTVQAYRQQGANGGQCSISWHKARRWDGFLLPVCATRRIRAKS